MSEERLLSKPLNFGKARHRAFMLVMATALVTVVGVSLYLRSYNEISDASKLGEIRTKIGDYVSLDDMGLFPVLLIWSKTKWPDRRACFTDNTSHILRWGQFRLEEEIEVCVSQALAGKTTIEDVELFFKANGLTRLHRKELAIPLGGVVIGGVCGSGNGPCHLSLDGFLSLFLKPYAFHLLVTTTENRVVDVKAFLLSI